MPTGPRDVSGMDASVEPGLAPTLNCESHDTNSNRPSLQRRVQNAFRWKSWGGEQVVSTANINKSTKGSNHSSADWATPSSEPHQQRHRIGHSVGSDVELSNISGGGVPLTYSETPLFGEHLHTAQSEQGNTAGNFGASLRSSASSSVTAHHDNNISLPSANATALASGLHHPGSAAALGTDDMCSVATQAGSRAHSFTSLYSMITDQGDQGSDAGVSVPSLGQSLPAAREGNSGLRPSALAAVAPGVSSQSQVLSYRGSDTGADEKASVSTLPLISETAFDEEQLLDDVQHLTAEQVANVQGFTEDQEDYNPLQSITGRPRVSSSHGSIGSSVSDLSAVATAGSGSARMPSSSYASYGRSLHSSQRSSSRSAHSHHQQQDEGLPVPFSTRKRPDNDETCSYATQAGSVHSVSSILSSAFVDSSTPHRPHMHTAAGDPIASGRLSGVGQQQQYPIHPLSEPDELEYYEGVSSQGDVDVNDFGVSSGPVSSGEADSSTAAATAATGLLCDESEEAGGGKSNNPVRGRKGGHKDRHQQHSQHQHHHHHDMKVPLLRGALRSVVAWGSGLGQRLHKASGTSQQQQQQHLGSRQEQQSAKAAAAGTSSAQAALTSSHEMASL